MKLINMHNHHGFDSMKIIIFSMIHEINHIYIFRCRHIQGDDEPEMLLQVQQNMPCLQGIQRGLHESALHFGW